MSVTQEMANQVVKANYEDIPPAAIERVKRGILDDIGIGFLGYHMDDRAAPFIEYAKEFGGGLPEATIIGDGTKVSCIFAAGVNAQMSSGTDFNETGPGGHPLSNIAQTGVAVGERVGASGREVITAVALGYEMNGRFSRSAFPLGLIHGELPKRDASFPGHSRHFATTAAITASKLLGLDETQTNHAIGMAWQYGPVPSSTGLMLRRGTFNLGACDWGIQAALLAQKGFEGPAGFIEIESHHDLDSLIESPSPYYYPEIELQLKPWISSRGTQPGVTAFLEIVKEEGLKPEEIEEVRVKAKALYFQYPFDNPEPTAYWDASLSVQWQYAMLLLGVEPGAEWLKEERFKDPAAVALAKKVKIENLPRATEIWESGVRYTNEAPNEVEVVARGRVYKKTKTYGDAPGSALNPMTKEHLEGKFKTQAAPVIGEAQSEELVGMLSGLQEHSDIRSITKLFASR